MGQLRPYIGRRQIKMFRALIFTALAIGSISAFSIANPKEEFTCEECVTEIRKFGRNVIQNGEFIGEYLRTHWCPTQNDPNCHNNIELEYPKMLDIVVLHFFMDGAIQMCQAEGICDVKSVLVPEEREFTCAECIQGLEYIEALMKDPLFIDQMVVRIEQTYCFLADNEEQCKRDVKAYFPSMHIMAMEHFLVPVDICARTPMCGAPTRPPPSDKPTGDPTKPSY